MGSHLEDEGVSVDFYPQVGVLGPVSQLADVGTGAFQWQSRTK